LELASDRSGGDGRWSRGFGDDLAKLGDAQPMGGACPGKQGAVASLAAALDGAELLERGRVLAAPLAGLA
jgi:hypothetical protein